MNRGELGKIQKTQILRGPDLLKPLPPQTRLFDNVSSSNSNSSELSGPFSDVVYTVEVENKMKVKRLYGKDLYTAFSFSAEFKTAIEQIKKEMIKENFNCLNADGTTTVNLVECKPKSGDDLKDNIKNDAVYEFLQFPGIDYEVELIEDEEDKKNETDNGKDKKKIIQLEDEETLFDTMSGYWRMLSVFDKFRISPPWYDAYAEGKEHWLNSKPIPPDVLEMSRKKCLDWLNKYFDK